MTDTQGTPRHNQVPAACTELCILAWYQQGHSAHGGSL